MHFTPIKALICLVLFALLDCVSSGKVLWKLKHKVARYKRDWIKTHYQYHHYVKTHRPIQLMQDVFPAHLFTQPMDHFNPEIQRTYKQRYWVNKDFWKAPNGPVFLYIGGEGPLDESTVMDGEHVDLAKEYGALIFSVEHRFYGESINKDGLELGQLEYLSSQQALADLASFHAFVSKEYNLTENNVWISFGGSYPGALSAWFRLKYPHLVYGALASSAPVRAKVNFEGYNNVVANSLSDSVVKGSDKCAAAVKEAFQTVDKMIADGQLADLEKDFKTCTPLQNEDDVNTLVGALADIFMGTVQYNNEMPGLNVAELCINMTQGSDSPYSRLQSIIKSGFDPENNCTDSSWKKSVDELMNTTSVTEALRPWIYQTCTQFGYYQTCDPGTNCIFSKYLDLEHNLKLCDEAFGLKANMVLARANFTNAYYGGDHPKGTRIIFVNGSIDPWHALSVLKNLTSTETAVFIDGTAHCANMGSNKPLDPPQLIEARKTISKQIGAWLQESKSLNQY